MRLRLSFAPGAAQCMLSVHYNHVLQAFLYRHLDGQLAQSLHDEGFTEGKRHLKLFTFSRLQGEAMVRGDSIVFPGAFSLVVASPDVRFFGVVGSALDSGTRVDVGGPACAVDRGGGGDGPALSEPGAVAGAVAH